MIRYLFLLIGILSLLIGLIGIFLPLLPTTPFVLLSAWLFAKSSDRFHQWLLDHKHAGPIISGWQTNKSMPKKAKILAIAMITLSMGCSSLFILKDAYLRAAFIFCALVAILFISRVPTTESFGIAEDNEG